MSYIIGEQRLMPEGPFDTKKCDSEENLQLARDAAKANEIKLFEGPYFMASGPTYETFVEANKAQKLGAGSLGMSTVPEIVTASALGIKVIAFSMISNLASFLSKSELSDDDVRDAFKKAIPNLRSIILSIVEIIKPDSSQKETVLPHFKEYKPVPPKVPIIKCFFL